MGRKIYRRDSNPGSNRGYSLRESTGAVGYTDTKPRDAFGTSLHLVHFTIVVANKLHHTKSTFLRRRLAAARRSIVHGVPRGLPGFVWVSTPFLGTVARPTSGLHLPRLRLISDYVFTFTNPPIAASDKSSPSRRHSATRLSYSA